MGYGSISKTLLKVYDNIFYAIVTKFLVVNLLLKHISIYIVWFVKKIAMHYGKNLFISVLMKNPTH